MVSATVKLIVICYFSFIAQLLPFKIAKYMCVIESLETYIRNVIFMERKMIVYSREPGLQKLRYFIIMLQ